MILSVSRRTDIPAFYSDWFFHRMKEESVYVRNPIRSNLVHEISLSKNVIDGIVFWTKNPAPILYRLDELGQTPYYFQLTLNPYGIDLEPQVPSKNNVVIPAFQELSKKIGREHIKWRYDPIILNKKYTLAYHLEYFQKLSKILGPYTSSCTVSFLKQYKNTKRHEHIIQDRTLHLEQRVQLLEKFSQFSKNNGIQLFTCGEDLELKGLEIYHSTCIDKTLFETISGVGLSISKDSNPRQDCHCDKCYDIGTYNSCGHRCFYCYANYNQDFLQHNIQRYDKNAPLLCGQLLPEDELHVRNVASQQDMQLRLF